MSSESRKAGSTPGRINAEGDGWILTDQDAPQTFGLAARWTPAGQDPRYRARCRRMLIGVVSVLLLFGLVFGSGNVRAQDTPEMLAAMRASLLPIPEHVPDLAALPPELRRQMPATRIQGHRWHADPALRFVQIDGRRVTEDGVAGQELWLRQIRKHAVVLQFREHLYVQPVTRGD